MTMVSTESIYNKFKDQLLNIEVEISHLNTRIDVQFDFVRDEIEIYIDSLKQKLEDIRESFSAKLNEAKEKMKTECQLKQFEKEVEEHKINVEKMEIDVNKLSERSAELLQTFAEIKSFNFKLKIVKNEKFNMNDDSVASLHCSYNTPLTKLMSSNIDIIQLDVQPDHIVQMSNGRLLVSSFMDHCLSLYDSQFNIIKRIDQINCENIKLTGLTHDNQHVYITDIISKSLMKLNANDLTHVVSLYPPKYDSQDSNCKAFTDICYHNGQIYACVEDTDGICVVNCETMSLQEIAIPKCKPQRIRFLNDVACIQHGPLNHRYNTGFFKLPSFKRLIEYHCYGSILAIDKWFYVYDGYGINVFTNVGNFVEKKATYFDRENYSNDEIALINNNKLIICIMDRKLASVKIY